MAVKQKHLSTPQRRAASASPEHECWSFEHWPANVFPHDTASAKQLYRTNKRELIAEGAISRVGRTIVFFPKPYLRWLRKQAEKVLDFDLPCNSPAALAKRGNGHDKTEGAGL